MKTTGQPRAEGCPECVTCDHSGVEETVLEPALRQGKNATDGVASHHIGVKPVRVKAQNVGKSRDGRNRIQEDVLRGLPLSTSTAATQRLGWRNDRCWRGRSKLLLRCRSESDRVAKRNGVVARPTHFLIEGKTAGLGGCGRRWYCPCCGPSCGR